MYQAQKKQQLAKIRLELPWQDVQSGGGSQMLSNNYTNKYKIVIVL